MTLPLQGWSYSQGTVRRPDGSEFARFDPTLNPDLDAVLMRIGEIKDAQQILGGVRIDGTDYLIRRAPREQLREAVGERDKGETIADLRARGAQIIRAVRTTGQTTPEQIADALGRWVADIIEVLSE